MSGYSVRRDRILFVDLELTCWEGAPPEGQRREIIEIGVAEVDVPSLAVLRTGSLLVRPVHSEVSPFCESLTGISAAMLRAQGRPLSESFAKLRKQWGASSKAWMAWGSDRRAVDAECLAKGLSTPFSESFHDIGLQFTLMAGSKGGVGLDDALSMMGIERTGARHRGIDDAAAAAEAWIAMAGRLRDTLIAPVPGSMP